MKKNNWLMHTFKSWSGSHFGVLESSDPITREEAIADTFDMLRHDGDIPTSGNWHISANCME